MLINDNWIGYIEDFIYQKEVTWMEKTVTSPYWTSLTLFSLASRNTQGQLRKRHKLHDAMYASEQRTAFKGQLYSAPMDWRSVVDQLQTLENDVRIVDLPVIGELLEKKVKISITSGLVDLNRYIKQATVRYSIMVRLIAMHHAAGEADYRYVNMKNVEERAKVLNPTDEAIVPDCLRHALDESEDEKLDDATDKAATPAERLTSHECLQREMDRARPLTLVPQRDSDSQKEVEESRSTALATVTSMSTRTGSSLLKQFHTAYIPRVFNLTLPRQVGGPDFKGQGPRWRRHFEDAPHVDLSTYTSMMARRSEAQIRWDWDLNPGLQSLSFASKVNLSSGIGLRKGVRQLKEANDDPEDSEVGQALKRLYQLLEEGSSTDIKPIS